MLRPAQLLNRTIKYMPGIIRPARESAMNKLIRNTAMTVALFAIVGAIAISDAQQAAPDLILSNGKIITVDQRFTIAEAVAIK